MLGELFSGAASLLGGLFGMSSADKANQMQMDAAQHGVEWRVKDAEKAGIHPLAALGMTPISMSPAVVGGDSFADAGQHFGRAIEAGSTEGQRATSLARQVAETQLEGLKIDNDIKRAELASRVRRSLVGAGVAPSVSRSPNVGPVTFPLPFGIGNWTTGKSATGGEIEEQYGDVAQEVYGLTRFLDDFDRQVIEPGFVKLRDGAYNALHELLGVNPAY